MEDSIIKTDLPTGVVTTVVDRYLGKRLNSPNDLVVKSDGTIWFTDPPYGILSNDELGWSRIPVLVVPL